MGLWFGCWVKSDVDLKALLLVTFLVPARKVTRCRAAPGALSRSEKNTSKALKAMDRVAQTHPLVHVSSSAEDAQRHGELK